MSCDKNSEEDEELRTEGGGDGTGSGGQANVMGGTSGERCDGEVRNELSWMEGSTLWHHDTT